MDSNDNCVGCGVENYFDFNNDGCESCLTECKVCYDGDYCWRCNDGFYLAIDPTDWSETCEACHPSCDGFCQDEYECCYTWPFIEWNTDTDQCDCEFWATGQEYNVNTEECECPTDWSLTPQGCIDSSACSPNCWECTDVD